MTTSFQRIFTFTIDRCPQLAPKNTYAINEWLANGYDVEVDIIPAIDRATKQGGKSIQSFNYFTGSIRSTHERRIKEAAKPVLLNSGDKDAARAAKLRWIRDSGISSSFISQGDFDWLKRYEENNRP